MLHGSWCVLDLEKGSGLFRYAWAAEKGGGCFLPAKSGRFSVLPAKRKKEATATK